MSDTLSIEGAWITRANGKLFFLNFGESSFELLFELPEGKSLSMGTYKVDPAKSPMEIDLTLADGIGKHGDRLNQRKEANVVEAIVRLDGDRLEFFAPPPELGGRPAAFPDARPGLIGPNLYLVFDRAA